MTVSHPKAITPSHYVTGDDPKALPLSRPSSYALAFTFSTASHWKHPRNVMVLCYAPSTGDMLNCLIQCWPRPVAGSQHLRRVNRYSYTDSLYRDSLLKIMNWKCYISYTVRHLVSKIHITVKWRNVSYDQTIDAWRLIRSPKHPSSIWRETAEQFSRTRLSTLAWPAVTAAWVRDIIASIILGRTAP
jgi:hypothetical protein